MSLSDLQADVSRVISGDASAFERIVEATRVRLVRMSARMMGSVADAEDVVQEAYVKAYRALLAGEFDGRSKVDTWLYRIVVNATLDAKRARKRAPTSPNDQASDEAIEVGWDGAASALAHVALKELAAWIDVLPEEQQAVLVLKAVEGLSSGEIAEVLQCSEGAVEQRLVRARAALRKREAEA